MFFLHGDLADKKHQSSASKKTPTKKEQKGAFAKKKKIWRQNFFFSLRKHPKNFQKRSFPFATQNNSFERYFEI